MNKGFLKKSMEEFNIWKLAKELVSLRGIKKFIIESNSEVILF